MRIFQARQLLEMRQLGALAHRYLGWAGSSTNSLVKHRPDAGKFSSPDQFTEFY